MTIQVYDVDAVMAYTVSYQDVTLAVCGDAVWSKWFPCSNGWRTGVSKTECAGRADHHYCIGPTVSHTDIQVPVFTKEFRETTI